jgi:hypothetical protein
MPWVVTKPRSAWMQAKDAWAALEPHAPQGAQRRDLAAIDRDTFARLIEALAALMPGHVSQELQDLAGLRPIGEVLGMPDRDDARLGVHDDDDDDNVEDW